MPKTKPYTRKIKVSDSGKCKALIYVDAALWLEYKKTTHGNGESASSRLEHLIIKYLAEDATK